jgi:hypothetical protein
MEDAPAEVGLIVPESLFVTTQETFTILLPGGTVPADWEESATGSRVEVRALRVVGLSATRVVRARVQPVVVTAVTLVGATRGAVRRVVLIVGFVDVGVVVAAVMTVMVTIPVVVVVPVVSVMMVGVVLAAVMSASTVSAAMIAAAVVSSAVAAPVAVVAAISTAAGMSRRVVAGRRGAVVVGMGSTPRAFAGLSLRPRSASVTVAATPTAAVPTAVIAAAASIPVTTAAVIALAVAATAVTAAVVVATAAIAVAATAATAATAAAAAIAAAITTAATIAATASVLGRIRILGMPLCARGWRGHRHQNE